MGRVSVKLRRQGTILEDEVTYFAVDVFPENGDAPWSIMRRYSEFHRLALCLRSSMSTSSWFGSHSSGVRFPSKLLFGRVGDWREGRRQGLERWLNSNLACSTPGRPDLSDFLLCGRRALPVEPSDLPEPSAPPLEGDDSLISLRVDLPREVGGENLIDVMVLGAKVPIMVPWGLTPGATLELWYDQTDGTLGVHHEQQWQALHNS